MKIVMKNCTVLNTRGKSILSPLEKCQGPQFKVSSEGLSSEIDIIIQSPIQTQTKINNALLNCAYNLLHQYHTELQLSPEIDILMRSPIQTLTKINNA